MQAIAANGLMLALFNLGGGEIVLFLAIVLVLLPSARIVGQIVTSVDGFGGLCLKSGGLHLGFPRVEIDPDQSWDASSTQ